MIIEATTRVDPPRPVGDPEGDIDREEPELLGHYEQVGAGDVAEPWQQALAVTFHSEVADVDGHDHHEGQRHLLEEHVVERDGAGEPGQRADAGADHDHDDQGRPDPSVLAVLATRKKAEAVGRPQEITTPNSQGSTRSSDQ